MPLAEIHVLEGRYDQNRMAKVSAAIQAALMNTLRVPAEANSSSNCRRAVSSTRPHSSACTTTDDLIILDLTFIQGRPKETRLALLKDTNTRVAAAAAVSPDDILISLYELRARISRLGKVRRRSRNSSVCLSAVQDAKFRTLTCIKLLVSSNNTASCFCS